MRISRFRRFAPTASAGLLVAAVGCGSSPESLFEAPEAPTPAAVAELAAPQVDLHRLAQGPVTPARPTLEATLPEPEPEPRLGPCEAPSALPTDPLHITDTLPLLQVELFPVHMLDIEPDPDRDVLYVVGMGGLFVLQRDGAGYRTAHNTHDLWLGAGETIVRTAQFSEIEVLQSGWLAVSNRDYGLSFVDATDPEAPVVVKSIVLPNAAGMHSIGSRLTVVTHGGELVLYDVSDPANPRERGRVGGLGNPWDVITVGDFAYVADNTFGLAVIHLRDPSHPTLVGAIETAGGAQDIDYDAGMLYVAAGSAGVQIFDPKVPTSPESVARLDYGTAVVSVSASDGRVWGATHADVFVADVSQPTAPRPLARQPTDEFAMAVHAVGTTAFVADWSRFLRMELDPNSLAPAADLERTEVVFLDAPSPTGEPERLSFVLRNRGGAPLDISGASITDPRFDFELDRTRVLSGSAATVTLAFYNDGDEVDATLCLATNDPEAPLRQVSLRSSPSARTAAGEFAPDFVLPTIESDEVTYRLSEQLGKPVVLAYFALW